MALFSEYAVTPDVLDPTCYPDSTVFSSLIASLKEVFSHEGIVRNLRDKAWGANLIKRLKGAKNPESEKILRLLAELSNKGRLIPSAPALPPPSPTNEREWCEEALASHSNLPLNGIIVSDAIRSTYRRNSLVESVKRLSLSTCTWWSLTNNSLRLSRDINDYKDALKLILRHAKSIKFIDPHIDPEKPNYRHFSQLLEVAGNRTPQPHVEIHRKILRGSGQNVPLWDPQNMEDTFRKAFERVLLEAKLKIKVFVWDDFHDRYLISNLGGIQMANGFDTSTGPRRTTWSRLGRSVRDDVQREFNDKNEDHRLRFTFTIPFQNSPSA